VTEPVRIPRTLRDLVRSYERVVIIEALAKCGGSRTAAAKVLGVRRQYLYARIRVVGIDLGQIVSCRGGSHG
jgi:DNA-binding NtrC family response regulator